MKCKHMISLVAGSLLLFSGAVNAGVYTDDLSRCLIESSTPEDKITLVKWMFTAMSLHPAVASLSNVTPQQRDDSNRDVANLFVKLLTQTCKDQANRAMQYEGQLALQSSFNVLGQVAGKELFMNPNVAAGMAGLERHLDKDKINKAFAVQ